MYHVYVYTISIAFSSSSCQSLPNTFEFVRIHLGHQIVLHLNEWMNHLTFHSCYHRYQYWNRIF